MRKHRSRKKCCGEANRDVPVSHVDSPLLSAAERWMGQVLRTCSRAPTMRRQRRRFEQPDDAPDVVVRDDLHAYDPALRRFDEHFARVRNQVVDPFERHLE